MLLFFYSVSALFFTIGQRQTSSEELKEKFFISDTGTIGLRPVDYTKTPIYKKIKHHPEDYRYLDQVDIFFMGHLSDNHLVTGFAVVPKKPGNYPCIVFNRGGNQEMGRLLVATAVDVMAPIAAEGYVVVATNYRGNSGGQGKEEFGGAEVNDIVHLIQSLPEIKKADPSRVGLLGISRGGMMNYLTLREADSLHIKAVVSVGGITDLEKTMAHHPEIEDVAKALIPDFTSTRTEAIKERSAVHWANELPENVPILLLHSTTDEHVVYEQVVHFADSLAKYRRPYQLISFKNDHHGLSKNKVFVEKKVLEWFDLYVKREAEFTLIEQRLEK